MAKSKFSQIPDDTHPKIEQMMIEGYRRMSGTEKMRRVSELNDFVNALALAETRSRHPEAGEEELRLRVASRRLPADLMRRAFGWDPDEKGY